ncbi:hypothetical protein [Nonlabens xiamenensis]|uniref:hypothetical protein n=1 Tax=Nonlabens xiamenensis TaxID=2341043 RepID=UPI000F607095|nr:hypothetical protein [Nonlabens xiamenensis]
MRGLILTGITLLFWVQLWAQVGIQTADPQASLEIASVNPAAPNNDEGLLIPRLDALPAINPGADQDAMLIYLTTASGNQTPGFYYWNNPTTSWIKMVPQTQIMMRTLSISTFNDGDAFNFSNLSFSNIDGAVYNAGTGELSLPIGIYEVEAQIRLNSQHSVDFNIERGGAAIPGTVFGATNPTSFLTNASTVPLKSVFQVTNPADTINFRVSNIFFQSGSPPSVSILGGNSYLIIKKLG